MAKKHYPVQRNFRLGFSLPSNITKVIGRLDFDLSRINHRLYRQSRFYEMKVDIDADLPDGATVSVYALQDTWMNQKAYQLAKKMFDENSKEEMAQLAKGSKARWNDFRVDLGETIGSGTGTSTPVGYLAGNSVPSGSQYTTGEYEYSEVSNEAGVAKTFRWLGTGAQTFNIIDEYDLTGNTNVTPSSPTSSVAYDGLEDEMDHSQQSHLSGDGNAPPYSASVIENQCLQLVATLHVDAAGTSKLSTGFFTAPCGFYVLAMNGIDGNQATSSIMITAKSGDYKGVAGAPMLE